jgi:small subunit ribosomal protein S8
MVTDQIADLITRIRNAQRAGHPAVAVPASTTKVRILEVLKQEGYIAGYESGEDAKAKPSIKIYLKYTDQGQSAIKELVRISKPGRRLYVNTKTIPRCKGGLGVVIVSTPQGMVSDKEARRLGVGGELICSVF